MLTGILILSIVGLLGILSHRRSRLENKIYKHIPITDWITVLVLPLTLYLGWFVVVKNILARPYINMFPLEDFDILAITILFMVYGFVGNSIHFTGKILWRYLSQGKHSMAYRINEMFHGKLSHYLVYLNGTFIIILMAIIEINHPVTIFETANYLKLTILGGIAFGYAVSKAFFYTNEWFGGYNKPLFFVTSFLLFLILGINRYYGMSYYLYPVNLFVITSCVGLIFTFILRQLIIFSRLNTKRRFRFLAKMFNA